MKPLAVTGLGVVSPIGIGHTEWLEQLRDVKRASARAFGHASTVLGPEKFPGARVAEVWGFDAAQYLGDKGLRNFDRLTKYLIVAARFALEDAGIKKDGQFISSITPDQCGICSSTAYGSLDAITELNLVAELEDPRYLNPARFPNTVINAAAGYVSIWEDLRAPNVTIVDGNCGALDAVLTCETHLFHGRGDMFLVGGGEVLSEPLYLAFRKLGAVVEGDERCEPGKRGSAGIHVGEGAAYLCVERTDSAQMRGARVVAEILGYGTAFSPPSLESMLFNASADAVARAVSGALHDATLHANDVDVVCGSASGLEPFDAAEAQGIDAAIGSTVPIAAPKAIYGETFGAAGGLGMAHALSWFQGAEVGPLIRGEISGRPKTVVVTTVGYYGNVSAVVLRSA